MKDMVSTARTSRERPRWIEDSLWTKMTKNWDTEEAKEKSSTTSVARMSDRGGLGPHIHVCGQKSYLQVEQEMIIELGRPVTLGEVFIRTHTKPDGTFVDRKAENVAETFERNMQARLSELGTQSSLASDGTSAPQRLSIDEENQVFLQSTFVNERGEAYGVGSLSQSILNGKRKYGSESSYRSLQDQLEEAQRQIGEQAASNARLQAEHTKVSTEQQKKIDHLSLLEKYLRKTDPAFLDFLAANENRTGAADSTEETNPQNS